MGSAIGQCWPVLRSDPPRPVLENIPNLDFKCPHWNGFDSESFTVIVDSSTSKKFELSPRATLNVPCATLTRFNLQTCTGCCVVERQHRLQQRVRVCASLLQDRLEWQQDQDKGLLQHLYRSSPLLAGSCRHWQSSGFHNCSAIMCVEFLDHHLQ